MSKYEFQVTGKINITDPCYDTKTWCGIYGLKAKPGTWVGDAKETNAGDWGDRVAELTVRHKDYTIDEGEWVEIEGTVGVDSGQAGVFDSSIYPEGENNGDADDNKSFYGRACRETCSSFDKEHQVWKKEQGLPEGYGVVDGGGFVSVSGYGDGSYTAWGIYRDDLLVAVQIVFIDFEEEEEEDV